MRKFTIIIIFMIISFIQSNSIQKFLQNNRKYLENYKCSIVYYIDEFKNIPYEVNVINKSAAVELQKYDIEFIYSITDDPREKKYYIFYYYGIEKNRTIFDEINMTSEMIVNYAKEECRKIEVRV